MSYRDLLNYTLFPMNDPRVTGLPPFVLAKVEALQDKSTIAEREMREKGPHVRIEYSLRFTGGNWNQHSNSDYAYVPVALVKRLGSVEQAFATMTEGVFYPIISSGEPGDLYQENGEPWEEDVHALFYAETNGCLHAKKSLKNISFWIASHDHVIHSLYLPGAFAWVETNNHYLDIDVIPPELLPDEYASDVLWVVSNSEIHAHPVVTRIHLVSEDQMLDDFPNMNFQ